MYHVVNPNATSWTSLVPSILGLCTKGMEMNTVPFEEWTEVLSQSAEEVIDAERNPAVKLLDFYRAAAKAGKGSRMLTSLKAEEASRTLQDVEAVNQEWVRNWMTQWAREGLIDII